MRCASPIVPEVEKVVREAPELLDAKPGPRTWHETFGGELAQVVSVLIFFALFKPSGWALWAYGVAALVLRTAFAR
jgi:hypothetical protein